MTKINKEYIFKIMGIVVMVLCLCNSLLYAFTSFKTFLRCPIGNGSIIEKDLYICRIVQLVRAKEVGLCYEYSVLLILVLRNIGEEAVLMGLYNGDRQDPYHYYVKSKSWGDIDVFPEGHRKEELKGQEIKFPEEKAVIFDDIITSILDELKSNPESIEMTPLFPRVEEIDLQTGRPYDFGRTLSIEEIFVDKLSTLRTDN